MRNSRLLRIAATGALVLAGCGRTASTPSITSGAAPVTRVLPLTQLFVLEMSGVPAEDTVVTFRTGTPRRIILRHGAPDNAVFVELIFPQAAFAAAGTPDSVTVSVRPRPGVYGVEVEMSLPPAPGALIRFKYPVHFAASVAALTRYGTETRLERALQVGTRLENGSFALLTSDRPASDNLEAPLATPGTYLVVAPK